MSGSSNGAFSASPSGRGNRFEDDSQDYAIVLPSLPTGPVVLNTVFFHADMRGRPYHVENFRDALLQRGLLGEVLALGPYQMNHVWAATFKTPEAAQKMLTETEMEVKGRKCVVVNPGNRDVRVKLHWMLHHVRDDDIRAAFTPYGNIIEVSREKWRVEGCGSQCSMTRIAVLRLNAGVMPEDIPHELRIAGAKALVVVPGRAPLCLRCQRTGHIRRECRVPRCTSCRRFGHEAAECVKTYATAATRTVNEDKRELFMDEADAEEMALAVKDDTPTEPPPTKQLHDDRAASRKAGSNENHQLETAHPPLSDEDGKAENDTSTACAVPPAVDPEPMDNQDAGASNTSAKRHHEGNTSDGLSTVAATPDEPPPKSAPGRRPSFKPKPTIPPDRRTAATPWASQPP
ncbi:uncharacterized protein LOC144166893 [Haemaphysalis longicornis]